jgi:hypothetical protein
MRRQMRTPFAFLQISLTQNSFISQKVLASGQNVQTIFNSIKEAFPDRQDIKGMGDDAFIATPGIHILNSDYYLTIGVGNINRNLEIYCSVRNNRTTKNLTFPKARSVFLPF